MSGLAVAGRLFQLIITKLNYFHFYKIFVIQYAFMKKNSHKSTKTLNPTKNY